MTGELVALDQVARQQHEEADEEDAQFGLFAEPLTAAGQRLRVDRRGPGRPLGARNKRTERMVAFLMSRHRSPIEVLLEISEANVADLAALYSCTLMEAGQEKRLAATAVAPYVASRMPQAIDVTKRSVVYLNIVDGLAELADQNAGIGLVEAVVEAVEYQQLSVATSEVEG